MASYYGNLPQFSTSQNIVTDGLLSAYELLCDQEREFWDLEENLNNLDTTDSWVYHNTGSSSEGLVIQCSNNQNKLFVHKGLVVVNSPAATRERRNDKIYLTALDAHPGYVHLYSESFEDAFGGVYRSDSFMIADAKLHNEGHSTQHGPVLFGEVLDFVHSLASDEWPEIAGEFTTRERIHNQPSQEMIDKITQQGCLYVPVGHPNSEDPGKEWRLSFSLAEKLLIRSWNGVQIKTYIAAKCLGKKHLSSKEPTVVPSYFIKTAMLWLNERFPESFWKIENILTCISAVLLELLSFTTSGRCPNYFIPENNMMDCFTTDQLAEATCEIQDILSDLPQAFIQSAPAAKKDIALFQHLMNSSPPLCFNNMLAECAKYYSTLTVIQRHYIGRRILLVLKYLLVQKLHQGANILQWPEVKLQNVSRSIQDKSVECAYERCLYQAVGDICQLGFEFRLQAESWYSKINTVECPSGVDDGGLLANACKILMFYCRGEKRKALELCDQEFERMFRFNPETLSVNYIDMCSVSICPFEAEKLRDADPNLSAVVGNNVPNFFYPVSVLLYVAIQCEKVGKRQKYVDTFMKLGKPFTMLHSHVGYDAYNHLLLREILLQNTLELVMV